MVRSKFQHVHGTDDISRDGSDRVCRVSHRMSIAGQMKNIFHTSQIFKDEGLIDVCADEQEIRIIRKFSESLFGLIPVSSECKHTAIKAARPVQVHDSIDQHASDKSARSRYKNRSILKLFPRQVKACYVCYVLPVLVQFINLHIIIIAPKIVIVNS